MLRWLKERGDKARISMCIRDLLGDLGRRDQTRTALVLASAQLFRCHMVEHIHGAEAMINRPADFSHYRLMLLYCRLEDQRNQLERGLARTKRNARSLGYSLPVFFEEHVRNTMRGLEVWMASVGVGVLPDRRIELFGMWQQFKISRPALPAAIEVMRTLEEELCRTAPAMDYEMFGGISDADWLACCDFTPESFRPDELA
jgi:hypothetical protein